MTKTIYSSSDGKAKLINLYDDLQSKFPFKLQEKFIETSYGLTHVLVGGSSSGHPLVIFHGGNSLNPSDLIQFLPLFKKFKIYAPDLIGHPGKSDENRLSPNNASYGKWCSDLFQGLKLDRAYCIGISYGAGILFNLASYSPQKIEKAIFIVPAGIIQPSLFRILFKFAIPMLMYKLTSSPKYLQKVLFSLDRGEKINPLLLRMIGLIFKYVKIESRMPQSMSLSKLKNFNVPVMLIVAEKDILFPGRKVIRKARKIIPNLKVVTLLEGAYHLCVYSKGIADKINKSINHFLRVN